MERHQDIKVFFNGQPYSGPACFINGYNGETSSDTDGCLCAILKNKNGELSTCDDSGNFNFITNEKGVPIRLKNRRGTRPNLENGTLRVSYEDAYANGYFGDGKKPEDYGVTNYETGIFETKASKTMKISEKQLTNIINESVKKNLAEYKLKQYIKGLVKESFDSMGAFSQFEDKDEESEPKKLEKKDNGVADFNHENENEEERRAQVEKFFGKPGVDIAQYAYKLYGITPREGEDTNEMKNARSKFMKCLNHEPNEAGYPYSFESQEVNKLQSMISSNQLNEDISPKLQSLMDDINRGYNNINWGVLYQKFAEKYFPDDDIMIVRSMVYKRPEIGDKFADFVRQCVMQESKTNKNMKKNAIKLNESTLGKIVAESVKKILNGQRG